jgi:hypothetical protein
MEEEKTRFALHKVALGGPTYDLTRTGGIAEDIIDKLSDSLSLRSITAYRTDFYHLYAETDGTNLGYQFTNCRRTRPGTPAIPGPTAPASAGCPDRGRPGFRALGTDASTRG